MDEGGSQVKTIRRSQPGSRKPPADGSMGHFHGRPTIRRTGPRASGDGPFSRSRNTAVPGRFGFARRPSSRRRRYCRLGWTTNASAPLPMLDWGPGQFILPEKAPRHPPTLALKVGRALWFGPPVCLANSTPNGEFKKLTDGYAVIQELTSGGKPECDPSRGNFPEPDLWPGKERLTLGLPKASWPSTGDSHLKAKTGPACAGPVDLGLRTIGRRACHARLVAE